MSLKTATEARKALLKGLAQEIEELQPIAERDNSALFEKARALAAAEHAMRFDPKRYAPHPDHEVIEASRQEMEARGIAEGAARETEDAKRRLAEILPLVGAARAIGDARAALDANRAQGEELAKQKGALDDLIPKLESELAAAEARKKASLVGAVRSLAQAGRAALDARLSGTSAPPPIAPDVPRDYDVPHQRAMLEAAREALDQIALAITANAESRRDLTARFHAALWADARVDLLASFESIRPALLRYEATRRLRGGEEPRLPRFDEATVAEELAQLTK
jgi:hypothetical protein